MASTIPTWQNITSSNNSGAGMITAANKTLEELLSSFDSIIGTRQASVAGNTGKSSVISGSGTGGGGRTFGVTDGTAKRSAASNSGGGGSGPDMREIIEGYSTDGTGVTRSIEARENFVRTFGVGALKSLDDTVKTIQAPLTREYETLVTNGDEPGQAAFAQQHPYMVNWNDLAKADKAAETAKVNADRQSLQHEWAVANQAHAEALRPAALKIQKAQLAATEASASEQELFKGVDTFQSNLLQEYATSQAEYGKGAAIIATKHNVPLDKSGTPDITGLKPEEAAKFRDALVGTLGVPPNSSAFKARLNKGLIDAKVPANRIISANKTADELFGSGTVLSAEHEAKFVAEAGHIDNRLKAAREHNLFVNTPESLIKGHDKVMSLVNNGISDDDSTKDKLKQKLSKWMTDGYEYELLNGLKEKIKIPPELIVAGFNKGVEKDSFFDFRNLTDNNIKNFLDEVLPSPEYQNMRKQAKRLEIDPNGLNEKDALRKSLLGATGVQNSSSAMLERLTALAQKKTF